MPPPESKGVWVFLEQRRGRLRDVSIQIIGEGRRIADEMKVALSGVMPGWKAEGIAREAVEYGVDKVYLVEDQRLENYLSRPYAKVMVTLIRKHKPEVVLYGASKNGRDLGGRVHAIIETGLAADCVKFEVTKDRNLDMIRPAYGGRSLAHIVCANHRPQMASARANVFKRAAKTPDRKGSIVREKVDFEDRDFDTRMVEFVESTGQQGAKLEDAKVVVAGGYGLRNHANFRMVDELAKLVGGSVAASRKAVDAGWFAKEYQVGQTGKTVRPEVYWAIGISGAVQHLAGMQESGKIIAINSDPNAAIFEMADYGIVGDLFHVVPELVKALKGTGR
jgi:electron transfer flavoprotein alpha subunit